MSVDYETLNNRLDVVIERGKSLLARIESLKATFDSTTPEVVAQVEAPKEFVENSRQAIVDDVTSIKDDVATISQTVETLDLDAILDSIIGDTKGLSL